MQADIKSRKSVVRRYFMYTEGTKEGAIPNREISWSTPILSKIVQSCVILIIFTVLVTLISMIHKKQMKKNKRKKCRSQDT